MTIHEDADLLAVYNRLSLRHMLRTCMISIVGGLATAATPELRQQYRDGVMSQETGFRWFVDLKDVHRNINVRNYHD